MLVPGESKWILRAAFAAMAMIGSVSSPRPVAACTTILIGCDLTAESVPIHAHNEDMGNDTEGRLWWVPPRTSPAGSLLSVPYVEIEQVPRTHGYWASGNVPGTAGLGTRSGHSEYDTVLVGLNDQGVSMSCNWAHSRAPNLEGVGIRRYAIRQLLLERASSARHGVEILGRLIETHGQADWGGLIYHLSDSTESWVVETTTRNWVARRVRDDEIRVTANRFRIADDYDLSSPTLVSDAIANGWLEGPAKTLDFRQVYGRPERMNETYDTRREERIEERLSTLGRAVEANDVIQILRDRYQGTEFYSPPQATPVWREDLANRTDISRAISTNLAQSTFVAMPRPDLAPEVATVMWFAFATPDYALYTPLYAAGSIGDSSPSPLGDDSSSTWRLFRELQRRVDPHYSRLYPTLSTAWQEAFDSSWRSAVEAERLARQMIADQEMDKAIDLLSSFSRQIGTKNLERAQSKLEQLPSPD